MAPDPGPATCSPGPRPPGPADAFGDREADASLDRICRPGGVTAFVQPVVRLADGRVVGYESLARMAGDASRGPAWWLALADVRGRRREVELACLGAAVALGPVPDDRLLFVNLSPSLLADPVALALLDELPDRLVVELTEQEAVEDYDALRLRLRPWLSRGVRIAIDDTGAGYSSLRHVIELTPDFLKLDRELVRDVDRDHNRRALVSSVVAFAREVGTSVIAEGVETSSELEVLRDAEVHLVQGYLLARPAPPWPGAHHPATAPADPAPAACSVAADPAALRLSGPRWPGPDATRLVNVLACAADAPAACAAVVEHLFRQSHLMPSIYLERHGELRCVAQRGLWQILDGFRGPSGITGTAWRSGSTVLVPDVTTDPRYRRAIPGVVSELCVPIVVHGSCRGVLNIESMAALPRAVRHDVETCATLLADRLSAIGYHDDSSAWDRLASVTMAVSGIAADTRAPSHLVRALQDASGLDSASLVIHDPRPRLVVAAGPLTPSFEDLSDGELEALATLVDEIRSSYTGGGVQGSEFVGIEALRAGGARAVVVLPLWAHHERIGTAILGHSRPVRLRTDDIRPLEVLADHVASVMSAWADQETDVGTGQMVDPDPAPNARAALTPAEVAARARHPSAAGLAPAAPTLTLVTNLGPHAVPELPPATAVDGDGPDARGHEGADRGQPDAPSRIGLFLERRHRRRASSSGG